MGFWDPFNHNKSRVSHIEQNFMYYIPYSLIALRYSYTFAKPVRMCKFNYILLRINNPAFTPMDPYHNKDYEPFLPK